jgi:glutathione S-transferase
MLEATSLGAKVFAICTVLLYFKFIVTARFQAHSTLAAGGRPPEDDMLGKLAKGEPPKQTYGLMIDVHADEQENAEAKAKREAALINDMRWKRIVANDLESIPLALAVYGAGLVVESYERVQVVAIIIYTITRFLHSYTYAKGIQPWRSIVWIVGLLAIVVGAVNIIVSVISK